MVSGKKLADWTAQHSFKGAEHPVSPTATIHPFFSQKQKMCLLKNNYNFNIGSANFKPIFFSFLL